MDTVVYKLHNVSKYPIIESAIQVLKKNGNGKIPISNVTKFNGLDPYQEAVLNLKLGKMTYINYNTNLKLPSHASGINVMIDNERDYIRFELSIPKLLFTNNVCEVIPPFMSKYCNQMDTSMIGLCSKYWYRLLKIIFNKIFNSKQDAEFYFQCVKKIRLPKNSEFSIKDYVTSIAIENPRYYWKIYLKGAEFEKNGKSQIRKYFQEYERSGFKNRIKSLDLSMKHIDELQTYADKILRYELEVRPSYMSYLFNKH